MNKASDHLGWFTAIWCWLVAHCEGAQIGLVYLSWLVATLNIVWLTKKIIDSFQTKKKSK